jgi:tetratricopeptide (TPR) repeat protein
VVELSLEGAGARRAAVAEVGFGLSAQDREDVRWYLEDYLQYPVVPAPQVAGRVQARLAELGADLFRQVFEANRDTIGLWDAVAGSLPATRVEVDAGIEAGSAVPWELLRDPATDGVLALRAGAFVRTHPETAVPVSVPDQPGGLRVLLVICRPGGRADVPFRSVASHLVRLSRQAREAFRLDVLRPPGFAELARALEAAKSAGEPYQVVHFDGHGTYLDEETVAAAAAGGAPGGGFSREVFSLVSPPRPGSHGYLVFEDPDTPGRQQLVDGPALGALLADTGVSVLVLNACRSAHAELATEPDMVTGEGDAHRRVRAYGSLAQEVMDAGVAGVVAMRYNVYVVTAARFIGEVYKALLAGQPLGGAVNGARRQLAADPQRQVGGRPVPLQDWMVPVVYEAAPLVLLPPKADDRDLSISLDQAEAGKERAALERGLPAGPDAGFFGRDETLLALDRAFDSHRVVLLHAWAGAGKTSTAAEFARWYALTGGTAAVLFTSFEHHLTLARLLDQVGSQFGPALEGAGIQWATLGDGQRRQVALQVLAQVPVLWIWDNIEPVAGFPAGTDSAWTPAEQGELAGFLRELADTRCRVLLTSRRDERGWLGDLPARVALPPMPMLEQLELARAVASRQPGGAQAFLEVEDWRPLLAFSQGNPLTITILVRQAIRGHHTSKDQINAFVEQLRAGAATVTDDAAQGRGASLAASLDYGFTRAFTDPERSILALLALFQGFTDIDVLRMMGAGDDPVPTVAGLSREAGIALLDRAADVGLLTAHGDGYYAVHPAIPWHLHALFTQHYGPDGSPAALHAARAWTTAASELGDYYHDQYGQGHTQVIGVLGAEEANLLQARRLALTHGWPDQVLGPMQGLDILYDYTGRAIEWRRLVAELVPEFTDPATGGPRPGREEDWAIFTSYRVRIARDARDWPAARQLHDARIAWRRERAAAALTTSPGELDGQQRTRIRNLAVAVEDLGHLLRDQTDPGCVQPYQEATDLYQRIGDQRAEAIAAFNLGHAYKDIPALRDLDQAEQCYQRYLELLDQHDTLARAMGTGQLGNLAYARFQDARAARAPAEELLRHFNDAAGAYHQSLGLLPDDAVGELAVAHQALGMIYGETDDTATALGHYQRAISYYERQDNRYSAGWTRLNAALTLANAGRRHDALLYARAALRDFDTVGPGAAARAAQARQLIALLEQEPADDQDTQAGDPT